MFHLVSHLLLDPDVELIGGNFCSSGVGIDSIFRYRARTV
jgi:hypothetical protein